MRLLMASTVALLAGVALAQQPPPEPVKPTSDARDAATVAPESSRVERLRDWLKRNTETVDPHEGNRADRRTGDGPGGDGGGGPDH